MTTAPESSTNSLSDPSLSNPNLSNPSLSHALEPEQISDLEVGLTAFKQGDYPTAIVLLEPALSAPADHPLTVRAQMGLAIAYEKLGEAEQSAQVCQLLHQSHNPQIQDWATKTLASLVKRHPELASQVAPASTPTGFSPAAATPSRLNDADLTGFTLLTASSPVAPSGSTSSNHRDPANDPISAPERSSAQLLSPVAQSTTSDPTQSPPIAPSLYQPVWRNAGRSRNWKALGRPNLLRLVVAQVATAIALYFAVQQVLYWIIAGYGNAIVKTLPRMGFRIVQPDAPTWTVSFSLLLLLVLLVSSRWLLDALLTALHGLKPLSLSALATYSPEASQSLQRFCRKYNLPLPALGVLPTNAPIALSYGFLPHFSRVVVSQGLLEQLADDEIATVYANEIGHLAHWTVPLMSVAIVVLQLPYSLYQVTSEWGNRKQAATSRASATLISVLSYGLFWLWRWVPLWLSRQRTYYSDRIAVDLTGNPNGYTRALLKIAIGIAKDVQQQEQTSYLLEGFEILTPLNHKQAISLGSLHPHTRLESVLEWERTNPYRSWLALNNAHPATGERLNLLMAYARHGRLDTELDWQTSPRNAGLSSRQWWTLLLQGAPYFGVVAGWAIALILSWIGWIGLRHNWATVSWLARDRTIWWGLPLVGFCVGTIVRINPFFPDIQAQLARNPGGSLLTLLTDPAAIPVNSQPTRLEGKLLGRSGISNALNQDLSLQTPTGIIKLHCTSRFGFLSSVLPQAVYPADLVKQPLLLTGWFRRGVAPWVDVETMRTTGGRTHRSYHPIWAFVAATIAALWGILTLFNL